MSSNNNPWTSDNIPDMSGKIIIITGANSGIGFEAARALAKKGAEIIMACRHLEKGQTAMRAILQEKPRTKLNLQALDLADLASVRQFADVVRESYAKIDILINNAGVMAIPYRKTADGFEMQFGTNHLGHFALTGLLLDLVLKAENSRVVTVSSNAHKTGRMNLSDLNSEKSYTKWGAYSQSKLSNLLFAYELQRKLTAAGYSSISVAAHPGYAATNLQAGSRMLRMLNVIMAQSQAMGALPILFAATHLEMRGGDYVGPQNWGGWRGYPILTQSNSQSHDEAAAQQLWQASEELTGVKFSIPKS